MDKVAMVEKSYMKDKMLPFEPGDTVRVWFKIVEGNRERLQAFEGTVIAIRGAGINKTMKVRKISSGVGVERTFHLHSPRVASYEIIRKAKVRRSKLYYLRDKVGKKARLVERLGVKIPKESDLDAAEEVVEEGAAAEAVEATAEETKEQAPAAEPQAEETQAEATQAEATQAEATQAEATQAEATQAEEPQAEAKEESPDTESK